MTYQKRTLDLIRTKEIIKMGMISVSKLADSMDLTKNDVRRIARNNGFGRYKDSKTELYNTDDFQAFQNETLKKRKMTKAHKEALNEGRKKKQKRLLIYEDDAIIKPVKGRKKKQ
jgi:predicted ATP-grasp superfamily ATP-dependent carboligase